jgi:acid stress chaperone HdeA
VKYVVAAVCLVALLAGCSGASNSGAYTTCRDFLAMRQENQDATVARMLKERNGRNSSTTDVINTRIKTLAACEPADKADTAIGDLG